MMYKFDHTEIVVAAGGKQTFCAHTWRYPPADQIGPGKGSVWEKAYRYIGPGAEQ
jgi:hypothetical protein